MIIGISGAGGSAEEQFRRITGSSKTLRAADGDAILDGHFVEVKKASSDTLNQVRAVKYIPLVALHVPTNQWYVVPPNEVVRLVAQKRRGQHTENPFESSTLSIKTLTKYSISDASHLRERTLAAIEQGGRWPALQSVMAEIRRQSTDLARESIEKVRTVLADGPRQE